MPHDARIVPSPDPAAALAWLQDAPGGALALVVTRARGCAVRIAPHDDAADRLETAARAALVHAGGESARVLAWHATQGDVPEGAPIAVLGAAAHGRKEAQRAVDALVAGLKGVAAREDLP